MHYLIFLEALHYRHRGRRVPSIELTIHTRRKTTKIEAVMVKALFTKAEKKQEPGTTEAEARSNRQSKCDMNNIVFAAPRLRRLSRACAQHVDPTSTTSSEGSSQLHRRRPSDRRRPSTTRTTRDLIIGNLFGL